MLFAALAALLVLWLVLVAPWREAVEAIPVPRATPVPTPTPATVMAYAARVFHAADGSSMPYRLLIPRKYNPKNSYPLVLFLHGDGERGVDNAIQMQHGGDLFLQPHIRRRYPAFVVFPQMPEDARWVDVPMDNVPSMTYPPAPARPMRQAMGILASLEREFHIDARRIYVMGVSDGGFGVWDALIRYPGLFAAGVSASGGADPTKAAAVLHTPIWVFHGAVDEDVYLPIEKNMVQMLQAMGGIQLRYTEYPTMGHVEAFTAALTDPQLLPWLFAQRLPNPPRLPRPSHAHRR